MLWVVAAPHFLFTICDGVVMYTINCCVPRENNKLMFKTCFEMKVFVRTKECSGFVLGTEQGGYLGKGVARD